MEEVYNYIEAYFTNTLSAEERKVFEERCVSDEAFANDVAFYITARQELRQELLLQKQQQWANGNSRIINKTAVKSKARIKTIGKRLVSYAAAACVIIIATLYFLFNNPSPARLAENYMQKKYSQLSVEMGPVKDSSLPNAIEAFNNKDYNKALRLFRLLETKSPGDADEIKYTGLVYLFMQDYDKALQQFDALSKMQLQVNPGNFLKAVTLMERDKKGDQEQARRLLQQVVKENTDGSEQAKAWLDKL